jgi:hypothetical protein
MSSASPSSPGETFTSYATFATISSESSPSARSFLPSRELNRYEPKGGSSLEGHPARLLAPFDMNGSPIAPYHLSDRRSLVPLPIRLEANDIALLYIASPGMTPSQPPGGASIRTAP